jgi:hypothetical protein
MKRDNPTSPPLPLHDYDPAVRNAVSWLGDRYLLAEPITRREERRPSAPYFTAARRWHPQPQANR